MKESCEYDLFLHARPEFQSYKIDTPAQAMLELFEQLLLATPDSDIL